MNKPRLTRPIAASLQYAAVMLSGDIETLSYDAGIREENGDKEDAKELERQAEQLSRVKDYIFNLARWYEETHGVKFEL